MLGQSELSVMVDPRLPSKVFQGITTEITGEGGSVAPLNDGLIKSVGRLRELGTPESAKYLADVQGRWPANGSKKVKQAIDSAVTSIPGGAK